MGFDFDFALSILPTILDALWATVAVTIASSIGAALIGFTWETLRRVNQPMSFLMQFLVDAIRSTPILVQIYFLFFVLPFYGLTLPAWFIGTFALSLYYSGYLAEVFKAGIDAIPKGQWEAAQALGLRRSTILIEIILPQMLRNIAAPMGNYFVSILKATPYLAVIAVPEMLGSALDIASDTFRYAEPVFVAGAVFLALALIISHLVRRMETRLLRASKR